MVNHFNFKETEEKLMKFWEKEKIYKFDAKSKKKIYSIDTPPPTVSGKMHLGHASMYSQMDFFVRYKRMKGFNVFYPFGTDDNGLATIRLIEKEKNVKASNLGREKFIKLVLKTLEKELRPRYMKDWKALGMSCDWDIFYTTINEHCQKISQRSFIELYKKGRIYLKYSPIIFCPQCQTAIAQVEMEDKQRKSTLNYVKAKFEEGYLIYSTTRPEVLYGCVGMSVNKNGIYVKIKKDGEIWIISKDALDIFKKHFKFTVVSEFKGEELIGKETIIPISNIKLSVTHDELTKTEYGTGIVYYCTYGGAECIDWITRHSGIEPINIMGLDGKYNKKSGKYKGMNSQEARKEVLKDLEKKESLILKEPIKHFVNVHERCGTDIEYILSDQWFIKYLDLKKEMLEWGKKLNWHPNYMRVRYENWVKGLKWDWNISRQRFYGIPIPVWHCKKCAKIILPEEKQLPVNPLKDKPIKKCLKCGSDEFIPEKDVLDTWATSSLTPQIAIELMPKNIQSKLFPMSLRPQAHDIITFWLFNTVVKSQLHFGKNPWKDVVISGFVLDHHGKKMSKSKGNVIEPQEIIEKYGSDALRYWTSLSKLGEDMPYQEKDVITGKKLVNKILNATNFIFMNMKNYKPKKTQLLETDKLFLKKLDELIENSTKSFEKYGYHKVRLETDNFFWSIFCDNYLEIVKWRIYNGNKKEKESAYFVLYNSLLTIIKLFAPIMPFITEKIYQEYFRKHEEEKSIHISKWPEKFKIKTKNDNVFNLMLEIISKVRKKKSEAKKSLKAEIILTLEKKDKDILKDVLDDLKKVTSAKEIKEGKFKLEFD